MEKKIYICHRPYHILRCCDLVAREPEAYNILIVFDVKVAGKNEYQRFDTNKIFYSSFDEVVEIERVKEPSLLNTFDFIRYCRERKTRYTTIVDKFSAIDHLYFFCDNELEIQILVGLIVDKFGPSLSRVLIDEGMATYSMNTYNASIWVKLYTVLITKILGLYKFNASWAYGASFYYNRSLANEPSKAHFRGIIEKLPPLSDEVCGEFRKKLKYQTKIPENRPYFIYVSQPIKKMEEIEMVLIHKLIEIASRHDTAFFIKLHPMQEEEKYIAEFGKEIMIEKSYPIELFYSSKVIVGGTVSSSLYNASLQGYTAFDLAALFNMPELGISKSFSWIPIRRVVDIEMFENEVFKL